MVQAKCTEKIRDKNNHIIGYRLIDKNKNAIVVKSNRLKEVIRSGQLDIINLTLTSDNRLVDKKPDTVSKPTTTPSKPSAEAVLAKARATGFNITTFDTDCGHKCYMASSQDNTRHLFIIPDDVKYLYECNDRTAFTGVFDKDIYKHMIELNGTLKVIGGKGFNSTYQMFCGCNAQYLDLTSFDTSNVTDMSQMFYYCGAQSLDLTSFDTSKVTNMGGMFSSCYAQSIDLTSFDTSSVTNMSWMFWGCKAQSLDLSSFNTSKVRDMKAMFQFCKAQYIDLSSFNTSNAESIDAMFNDCKAQIKVNDPKLKIKITIR